MPRPQTTRRGLAGAFLFGLAFGTALGPCTFAFLGPVIGATVQAATAQPALAALLVFAYGGGHCAVLALAGSLGPVAARYTVWSEGRVGLVRAACGALNMIGGLYLIYSAR